MKDMMESMFDLVLGSLYLCLLSPVSLGSVHITPTSSVIDVGRSFTFTCTVSGEGALVIFRYGSVNQCTIHRDGTVIRNESGTNCSRQGDDSTSFFMTTQHALRVHNRKDWRCQVGGDRSNNATLQVQYAPNVTRFTANGRSINKTVNQGVNVTLQCRVDASPSASITIRKGNSDLSTRRAVSMATETLKSVSCRNMATYHCMASNSIGLHSSKVQLFVRCSPSEANYARDPFSAAINGQVTLYLAVLAFPVPIFTWHGPSGEIIRVNNGTFTSESEFVDSIVISDVSKKDIGDYVLSVHNDVGDGNFTVTLKLKDSLTGATMIGVIVGCVVLGIFIIIFICIIVRKLRKKKKDLEEEGELCMDEEKTTLSAPPNIYREVKKPNLDEEDELCLDEEKKILSPPPDIYTEVKKPKRTPTAEGDESHTTKAVIEEERKVGRDEDGLNYIDVEAGDQPESDVIHGADEDSTQYAEVQTNNTVRYHD